LDSCVLGPSSGFVNIETMANAGTVWQVQTIRVQSVGLSDKFTAWSGSRVSLQSIAATLPKLRVPTVQGEATICQTTDTACAVLSDAKNTMLRRLAANGPGLRDPVNQFGGVSGICSTIVSSA